MLHDELCPGGYGFMCLCGVIVAARGVESGRWARRNAELHKQIDSLSRRSRELSQLEVIDRLRQKLASP